MPELVEMHLLADYLAEQLVGKTIAEARLFSISALKTYEPPVEELLGSSIVSCNRRGKFLVLQTDDLKLVVHLALSGWLRFSQATPTKSASKNTGPTVLQLIFNDQSVLRITEAGKKHQLAIYLVRDLTDIVPIQDLGPDPLDLSFTSDELTKLLQENPSWLKNFLTAQKCIAGIGNAYSDEILFAAKLPPHQQTTKLSPSEIGKLYHSIKNVLTAAIDKGKQLPAHQLKDNKRRGLKVHGRQGQPCFQCSTQICSVAKGGRSYEYCPKCQNGDKKLADRRLSKLLK